MTHAGGFQVEIELMLTCPFCDQSFDFTDVDDWNDGLGDWQVGEPSGGHVVDCPECEKAFSFDIESGVL